MNKWRNVHEANEFYKDENSKDNRVITKNLQISLNNRLPNNNMAVITPGWSLRANTITYQNLLQMGSSYIVVDPQGELHSVCAEKLMNNGYEVKVLDLIDLEKSVHYDPFAVVKGEHDVLILSDYFAELVKSRYRITGGDPFSSDGVSLYSNVLFFTAWYHAIENGTSLSMKKVVELARMESEVIGADANGKPVTKLSLYMSELKDKDIYSSCTMAYNNFKFGSGETTNEISFMFNEIFEDVCAAKENSIFDGNDIIFRELITGVAGDTNKRMAVFIKVPICDNTYNWIGSLFLSQCTDALLDLCNDFRGRLPVRVEFFLIDMACGCVPLKLERTLSIMHNSDISFVLNFNSIEQLQEMYSDDKWVLILDNQSIIVYTGVNNSKGTFNFISAMLGYAVKPVSWLNPSKYKVKELMSIDKIKRIPNRAAIILIRGDKPIYDKKAYDLSMMYSVKK